MRIAVDAMGGDHAPDVVVAGAVQAAREFDVEIVLVGDEARVTDLLRQHDARGLDIQIVHASQVIEMIEHTIAVKQKPDASMVVAMKMLRRGEVDAVASAGNSGAVMATALLHLGRIRGVQRPALMTLYPTVSGPCVLLDIGANADCKPDYLIQFAVMGAIYAERMLGRQRPRVAIVSNGEEPDKGSMLVRDTFARLTESPLHFVGNVEGKDIPQGKADVVVTDGFTGNVIIKLTEGVVSFLGKMVKRQLTGTWRDRAGLALAVPGLILTLPGLLLMAPSLRTTRRQLDWREYGGAPLMGVDGVVVIGHGRSDAYAIRNMIRQAMRAVEQELVPTIRDEIQRYASQSSVHEVS